MLNRHSIVFKMAFTLLIVVVLANLVIHQLVNKRIEELVLERIEEEGSLILQSLDWALSPLLEKGDDETIQRLVENIGAYEVVNNIRIYDQKCIVLFSNALNEKGIKNDQKCVVSIIKEKKLKATDQNLKEGHFSIAMPIRGSSFIAQQGSDVMAILYVDMNVNYANRIGEAIKSDFQWIYIASNVLLIGILAFIFYMLVGRPLSKIKGAAHELGVQHYDHRMQLGSHDEFGDLADVFNQMAENIEFNTKELEKAKTIAEAASQAKMSFLANMSHEIRTPLNTVIGFTEILEESETDSDKKHQLSIVKNAGNHLLSIINDILDVSKIEMEHIQLEEVRFDIREELKDIGNMFRLKIQEKNLEFYLVIEEHVPEFFMGDVYRIRQIFINLIGNAIKFTEVGNIQVNLNYLDGHMIIQVKDTGIGIESEKIKFIFDAFSQTDASTTRLYGGTGLGLAISKRLAQMMGGDIKVKSSLGIGSEFEMKLNIEQAKDIHKNPIAGEQMVKRWIAYDPEVVDLLLSTIQGLPRRISLIKRAMESEDYSVLDEESHALKGIAGNYGMKEIHICARELNKMVRVIPKADPMMINELIVRLERVFQQIPEQYFEENSVRSFTVLADDHLEYKILVAEDVEENRLLLDKILGVLEVEVEFAKNGLEALEKLHAEVYDLLLLDIQMPLLDGSEVIKWVRENESLKKLYVIAVTANATSEDMQKYLGMGCDWFMSKPIKKKVLRDKVKELMVLKMSDLSVGEKDE